MKCILFLTLCSLAASCTTSKPASVMQSKPNTTPLSEGVYIQTKNIK